MPSDQRLPDPDHSQGTDVVIYDGHCHFCQAQVERLAWFDSISRWIGGSGRLSFLSLHDPRVGERFCDLTHEMLMEQMFVVERRGRRRGGADAVRYLSRRLPALWPAVPILHLPGSARLWRWLYRQIARQRYRWNRADCDGGSCEVHFADKPSHPRLP